MTKRKYEAYFGFRCQPVLTCRVRVLGKCRTFLQEEPPVQPSAIARLPAVL